MTTELAALLDQLDALEAAASASPWSASSVPTSAGHCWKIAPMRACIYVDGDYLPHDAENVKSRVAKADANLIAALRNSYALLRDALRASDAAIAADALKGER